MRLPVLALASLVALATFTGAAAPAHADEKATCEVVEIEASNTDKPSIDPALDDLKKKLRKGPFAGFNTFRKSARISKPVAEMKATEYDTPRGSATLVLRGVERPAKKRARLTLGIALAAEDGKRYIETRSSVDADDFLLFARTVNDRETIITAIGCR